MQVTHLKRIDRKAGYSASDARSYNAKPRVYFSVTGETLLDDLTNRHSRPSALYRSVMGDVLDALGCPGASLRWSQRAGCGCGCSPGFVVDAPGHFDAFVTVSGADAAVTQ